jgi:hypothetical protein
MRLPARAGRYLHVEQRAPTHGKTDAQEPPELAVDDRVPRVCRALDRDSPCSVSEEPERAVIEHPPGECSSAVAPLSRRIGSSKVRA